MNFLHLTLFNVQSTDLWQLGGSSKDEVIYIFMNSNLCPQKRLRNNCSHGGGLYLWSCQLLPLQHSFFGFLANFPLTWSKALENKRKHSLSCAHLPQQCQPLLWIIKNELCSGMETWFGFGSAENLHRLNLTRFTFLFPSPLLIFFFPSPILSR